MRFIAPLLLLCAPMAAVAQPYGSVWLVPAAGGGFEPTCLFADDNDTELCEVAVVIALNGSWSAFDGFRVTTTLAWTWAGDVSPHAIVGDSQSGASLVFNACVGPQTAVMTVRYLCPGTSPCGQLSLVPAVGVPLSELVSCDGTSRTPAGWGALTVNGVFDVPPGGIDPDCYCLAVPTEEKTWGRIKALYGE